MKLVVAAVLLLLLPATVFAVEENQETIFESEELVITVGLSSSFTIVPEAADAVASSVLVNFTLFPKNTAEQKAEFIELSPQPRQDGDSLLFEWTNPALGEHSFSSVSEVTTQHTPVKITRKVRFPVTDIPQEIKKFVSPSEYIDYENSEIMELASSLAEGEDDLFVVVYKLAAWSNENIEYNLSTLTANVTKSASWVLQNRKGVCDELTNLFIAMSRSVGIPARFVTGISYTDSTLFPERWGFHGWAEVYFPGYGWVPFDVTYGEFGFVDPGHIKILESESVSATRTNYQWVGRDISLETQQLKPEISVKEARGSVESDISLVSTPLKGQVGFGSYNIEELEISNRKNYYVVASLVHSNTEGIELLEDTHRNVLLRPGETRYEYFSLKVDSDLKDNFLYTFPLSTRSGSEEEKSSFQAVSVAREFTLEDFEHLKREEEETKAYSRNVSIDCTSEEQIYLYESAEISCTVSNTGNVALENLKFCHRACESFSLGISRSKTFEISEKFGNPGENRVQVRVTSPELSASEIIDVDVLEEPQIKIVNIRVPGEVSFKEDYSVVFTIEQGTPTVPQKVTVRVAPTEAEFNFEEVDSRVEITADLNALDLAEGNNTLIIRADYFDTNNKAYTTTEEIAVTVKPMSFLQKMQRFVLVLFSKIP